MLNTIARFITYNCRLNTRMSIFATQKKLTSTHAFYVTEEAKL